MPIITSKATLNPLIQKAIEVFGQKGENAFVKTVHAYLLKAKIRFPLLEHAAEMFCKAIPTKHHYSIAESIMQLNTIGGNVLVGIVLRNTFNHTEADPSDRFSAGKKSKDPSNHSTTLSASSGRQREAINSQKLNKAMKIANAHIVYGNVWYVCDIIGERVAGYALLTQPEKTIPLLRKMARDENKWIVRTVGVATHYAVKKGLKKKYAEEMFGILLTLGDASDFHTKKGIGWAVKTIAKFHPEMATKALADKKEIKQWFKTKIRIGLGRSEKYASRYKS